MGRGQQRASRQLTQLEQDCLNGSPIALSITLGQDFDRSGRVFQQCGFGDARSCRYIMSGMTHGTRELFERYAAAFYNGNKAAAWRGLAFYMLYSMAYYNVAVNSEMSRGWQGFEPVYTHALYDRLAQTGVDVAALSGQRR